MKFLHLSDLHIGKRLNGVSLCEDQRYIFKQIIEIAAKNKLGAAVIAGDVYDKSAPSAEAVELFDDFLTELHNLGIPIMIISGNHDSPERLSFGRRIMDNVHICCGFDGTLHKVRVCDVDFYLLPFVKPQTVRSVLGKDDLDDFNEMAELIFKDFKSEGKSVLVMHQFITAGAECPEYGGSESVTVGTIDNIDLSHFSEFDYVALGHIHRQQSMKNAVYCGSPLKYSFAEASSEKYAVIVDTDNDMSVEKIPLKPLHDMRKIKGSIENLLDPEVYGDTDTEDYISVTLTDRGVIDAAGKLRAVYKNVLEIHFEGDETETSAGAVSAEDIREKSPEELFGQFFKEQNGAEMTEEQREIVKEIFEEL